VPSKSRIWCALLRGIGASTHKKMSMKDLRDASAVQGFTDVSTYIASGNLIFKSSASKPEIRKTIQGILASHELENAVILRTRPELQAVVAAAPHAAAAKSRPNLLLTVFFDKKLNQKSANEMINWQGPENIVALQRELSIDYTNGVARSKLTPTLIDRTLGQAGTARNWNTLNKLIELTAE